MAATPTYRLADSLLDGKLREFVLERRNDLKLSWRAIARDLKEVTNGEVDLSFEVLRLWFNEKDGTAA